MKSQLFFTLITLSLLYIKCASDAECESKWILDQTTKKLLKLQGESPDEAYITAYNGLASCYTLRPKDGETCCYIKVKYKIRDTDQKYTAKGCQPVSFQSFNNFKGDVIDGLKQKISSDEQIEDVKVSVKCNSSSFLKVAGLLILALLF